MSGMQLTAKRSRSHGRRGLAGRLDVLGADAQPYLGDAGAAQAAGRFVRQRQQRPLNGYGRAAVRRLGRQEVHRRVADEAADEVRGRPVVHGDRRVHLQDLALLHHRDAIPQAERLHSARVRGRSSWPWRPGSRPSGVRWSRYGNDVGDHALCRRIALSVQWQLILFIIPQDRAVVM